MSMTLNDAYTISQVVFPKDYFSISHALLAMDEGIGNLTRSLKVSNLWENTLIVFTSDNGASDKNGGNNAPLRGHKSKYFEGGKQ